MLPLVNDAFFSLSPYVPGKPVSETERELGLTGVIKLASNENPLGPSPKALEAMRSALVSVHDYPDGGAFTLKHKLAKTLGVGEGQLVIGNGTNEIIEMLVRTCMRDGENLIFAAPSFIAYKLCAQAAGREVRDVPTKDMRFDLPAMAKAMDARTKLVFIANPNNPTGTYATKAELDAFLAAIPRDVIVVLDEAYIEYVEAADYPNGLAYLKARPRTVVLRTFSKAYGLAGLRVGYGVAEPELADFLNRGRLPFNCNSLAQVAAVAALDDHEHVQRAVTLNRDEMKRIVPKLRAMNLTVWDSVANFVLVDFRRDGAQVFQRMLREGVIIRPLANYGLATHARITLGTRPQNDRLLAALERVLAS